MPLNLAPALAGHRLPSHDRLDQLKPPTRAGGTRYSVDTARAETADGISVPQAVAVDELLERPFVRSVMTHGPGRMRLIERPIVED